jgi:hypothetical protein
MVLIVMFAFKTNSEANIFIPNEDSNCKYLSVITYLKTNEFINYQIKEVVVLKKC